jgi:hypothetical protein
MHIDKGYWDNQSLGNSYPKVVLIAKNSETNDKKREIEPVA